MEKVKARYQRAKVKGALDSSFSGDIRSENTHNSLWLRNRFGVLSQAVTIIYVPLRLDHINREV